MTESAEERADRRLEEAEAAQKTARERAAEMKNLVGGPAAQRALKAADKRVGRAQTKAIIAADKETRRQRRSK